MVNNNMFSQAKLIIGGIIVALLLASITSAVWYYKWSQTEIKILNENNARLELAVENSEAAVASLKADSAKVGASVNRINNEYQAAREENNALRTKLSRHNIGYLAKSKPGLVTKIINKGAGDAERCFEIASGAEITEQERNATKKSETNSSCPRLANPNYVVTP